MKLSSTYYIEVLSLARRTELVDFLLMGPHLSTHYVVGIALSNFRTLDFNVAKLMINSKTFTYLFLGLMLVSAVGCMQNEEEIETTTTSSNDTEAVLEAKPDSLLRHVVLFAWKPETPAEKIAEIVAAFGALPAKIEEIYDYEFGLNNSPEGLNKDLTHCFLVTFKSEADRSVYLPHPDHQAFVDLIGPHVADVLVVDFWGKS